jgi:hypothetical protein
MSISDSYEAYDWVYLRNLTDEQLESLNSGNGYYDRTVAVAQALKMLHSQYAIDPMAMSTKVSREFGFSLSDWRRVVGR